MKIIEAEKEIGRGKTKSIFSVEGDNSLVIIRNRDEITKNDDPEATRIMLGKGEWATATTTATFEILKAAGIPVAFERRINATDFLAKKCQMIKLEVVARRYADGSYLKRNPHLRKIKNVPPHRFHRLEIEFFLKTSGGVIIDKDGCRLGNLPNDCLEKDKIKRVDDPFITDPNNDVWSLRHPKFPVWDDNSGLSSFIGSRAILPDGVNVGEIENITRKVFLVLEAAWAKLGYRLVDFKIEFGIGPDGELFVADVIDNDSWRLRTWDWQELSKQLFRDNAEMAVVAARYSFVAELVKQFRIPKQAIVLWTGSDKDVCPTIQDIFGVIEEKIIRSGHKGTKLSLEILEGGLAGYPEGGVIIAIVGKSDGLGPILAAYTSWPVIAVCASQKDRSHDVWSSLEMPSGVPLMTILSPENAVLAALNILAQSNPVAYMYRQYAIEKLDI
jgi:phosphoribosylaminoimidazole carboxylase / phosphoribosylaminoimidazole-succinocarboxamide synthase